MNLKNKINLKAKFIYKYGIPLVMVAIAVELLIFAPAVIDQNQDISDTADTTPVNSESTEQLMTGVHLIESRADGKEWELWAQKAYNTREDGNWILDDVKVRVFGAENLYYDISGKKGLVHSKEKSIFVEGEVDTLTSNGYLLKMNDVTYSSQEKKLSSKSEVKMLGPEIKGESRLVLTGQGMETHLDTNQVHILKNINANKTLQKGQLVTLKSESAIFNSKNYRAEFLENLIVDYGSYRVTGKKGVLEVESQTHRVSKVVVESDVKLSDLQRLAIANQATFIVPERRVVLSGDPRLIQNNNELRGAEISFQLGSSQIKIKKAKAKLDKTLKVLE